MRENSSAPPCPGQDQGYHFAHCQSTCTTTLGSPRQQQLHLHFRAQRLKGLPRPPGWADANVSLKRNFSWLCPAGATRKGRPDHCAALVGNPERKPCPPALVGHRRLVHSGRRAWDYRDCVGLGPIGVRTMSTSKFQAPLQNDSTLPPTQASVTSETLTIHLST